jgi:hypothetical protein
MLLVMIYQKIINCLKKNLLLLSFYLSCGISGRILTNREESNLLVMIFVMIHVVIDVMIYVMLLVLIYQKIINCFKKIFRYCLSI